VIVSESPRNLCELYKSLIPEWDWVTSIYCRFIALFIILTNKYLCFNAFECLLMGK
jgi:hypothetical protein